MLEKWGGINYGVASPFVFRVRFWLRSWFTVLFVVCKYNDVNYFKNALPCWRLLSHKPNAFQCRESDLRYCE